MILDEVQVSSNQVQPERYPRPIISTLDTWDQSTQVDYPYAHAGRRPGWNIPSVAVTNESVNTIRSSSNTRFQSPRLVTKAGMHLDPATNSLVYKPVANMAQSIQADSSVQIQFSMTAKTAAAQSPFFAIYRDNVKISQEYRQSSPGGTVNPDVLVMGSYVDPNPPKGWHTYDLRWHVDPIAPSLLTASSKNRTFQASNLRAQ